MLLTKRGGSRASKRPRPFSPGNTVYVEDDQRVPLRLQRGPGRSAREIRNRGSTPSAERQCFKEAQAVQPGKLAYVWLRLVKSVRLQRGPGRSAREIGDIDVFLQGVLDASKRPRPFSPGNMT